VVVLALTVLALLFIIRLLRRGQLRAKYSILWLSLGLVLVVLAASPRLLDRVSLALGITYGPATFFFGAIFLLFLVVIHFSYELSRLEERTRTLAEEIALLRAAKKRDTKMSDESDSRRGVDVVPGAVDTAPRSEQVTDRPGAGNDR
jgi:hypothetical protein